MEVICKRFSLVCKTVLKNLDDQSLINSNKASREMNKFINKEKFYWIQTIKKYSKNFEGHEESWKEAISKAPNEITKQLAIATHEYFKNYESFNVAPLHVAVEKGSPELCEYIISKTKEKNPQGNISVSPSCQIVKQGKFVINKTYFGKNWNITPLHLAAINGNLSLVRLIMDCIDDGNPMDVYERTPLHMAARNNHLEVCRLIIERVIDKNPENHLQLTPLHEAAIAGNLDVCKLIIERIKEYNPSDKYGFTPLHVAADRGYLDVCKFIIHKTADKNPVSNFNGWTPLHFAAKLGHFEICKLIIENIDDKHPLTHHGETPMILAKDGKYTKVYQLFES